MGSDERKGKKWKQMENLKSNLWLIDSKCGECFGKEVKCCVLQMEACKSCLHFWATIIVNGGVSESERIERKALWQASQVGVRERVHIVIRLVSKRKTFRDVSPALSFSCHPLSFFLLPVLPYPLFPLWTPPSFPTHLINLSPVSDAELRRKKSHLTEFMACILYIFSLSSRRRSNLQKVLEWFRESGKWIWS